MAEETHSRRRSARQASVGRRRPRLAPWVALAALAFSGGGVFAVDRASFHDAYRQGLRAAEQGQWEDARKSLITAARLHPRPGKRVKTYGLNFMRNYDPYYHLARVELELGLLGDATGHLMRSRRAHVMPRDEIETLARQIRRARTHRMKTAADPGRFSPLPPREPPAPAEPRLSLTADPESTDVFIDGRLMGTTPVELPLEAGSHRLELRAEGYERERAVIVLVPGEQTVRHFDLTRQPPPRVATAPEGSVTAQPAVKASPSVLESPGRPALDPSRHREGKASRVDSAPEGLPAEPMPQDRSGLASGPSLAASRPGFDDPAPTPGSSSSLGAAESPSSAAAATTTAATDFPVQQPPVDGALPPWSPGEVTPPPPARARERSSWMAWLLPFAAVGTLLAVGGWRLRQRSKRQKHTAPRDARTQPASATVEMPHTEWTPSFSGSSGPPHAEGSVFGGYVIQALLGRGGMASTYAARRNRDGQPVAIKIPYAHLLDEEEFVKRFLREGALGATLHHPNIVRIYEAGAVERTPFIAMELIEGKTLEALLEESGSMGLEQGLEILRGIALALDYAHLKDVIHRDLKPENVMCLEGGRVKVMDYGIARVIDGSNLTATHSFLGTPNYAAPESADPTAVDGRSDLYSLGIIGYRLFSGRLPFSGRSALEIIDHHRRTPLPPFPPEARVPPAVEAMIRRLTSKSKQTRHASAEKLLRELNQLLNSLPAPASP